jgi:hypothetical protein
MMAWFRPRLELAKAGENLILADLEQLARLFYIHCDSYMLLVFKKSSPLSMVNDLGV